MHLPHTLGTITLAATLLLPGCDNQSQSSLPAPAGTPQHPRPSEPVGDEYHIAIDSFDTDAGFLHDASGVGVVYPAGWVYNTLHESPDMTTIAFDPEDGDPFIATVSWTLIIDAPGHADSAWLAQDELQTMRVMFGDRAHPGGTHEATGETWHAVEMQGGPFGEEADLVGRSFVRLVPSDGRRWKIKVRITAQDDTYLQEAIEILDQFRWCSGKRSGSHDDHGGTPNSTPNNTPQGNAPAPVFDAPLEVGMTRPSNLDDFYKLLKEVDDPAALLEKYPAAVTASVMTGRTLLHTAASHSDAATVEALIDAGADVHIVDYDGYTPLHNVAYPRYAVENQEDRLRTVRLLLDAGADPNAFSPGGTPTGASRARSRSLQIDDPAIQILIDAGGDPDGMPQGIDTLTLAVGMPIQDALKLMEDGEYEPQFPPAPFLADIQWDRETFTGACF